MSYKVKYKDFLPWIMWGFSSLFYFYQFILRVCPSVMADDWMTAFSVDTTSLGIMVAFYYYAYAGMQIPLGLLMDKLGPRRLLSSAGGVCALGCLLTAITQDLWVASMGRFLMGMGAACGFLGTMKMATLWFPPSKIGMIAGLSTALGTLGGILGQAPLSLLNDFIGWQGSLYILTLLGISVSLFIWFCVKDAPQDSQTSSTVNPQETVSLMKGLSSVLFNSQTWLIALHGFLMYTPLAAIADLWGVPFLKSAYGFEEKYAATMASCIYVGVIVGGFFLGKFTNLFKRRRSPMVIGASLSCICYALFIFVHPLPDWGLYGLLFVAGASFATECLCFPAVCEQLPRQYGGIAIGFTNMVVMSSGVLMQPLMGWLLETSGNSQMKGAISHYSLEDFQHALWVIPVCLLGAIFILFFIRDKPTPRVS